MGDDALVFGDGGLGIPPHVMDTFGDVKYSGGEKYVADKSKASVAGVGSSAIGEGGLGIPPNGMDAFCDDAIFDLQREQLEQTP